MTSAATRCPPCATSCRPAVRPWSGVRSTSNVNEHASDQLQEQWREQRLQEMGVPLRADSERLWWW